VRELLDQRQTFTVPERCDISYTQEPSDTEIDDRRRHRAWLITLEHTQAHGLIRKAARRETLDREEALPRVQLLVDTCTKLSYEDLVHPAGHTFRVVEEVDDRGGEQIVASRDFIALWGRSRKFAHVAGDTPHSAKTLRRAARETLLRHGLVVQDIVTRWEKIAQGRWEVTLVQDHAWQVTGGNRLCGTMESLRHGTVTLPKKSDVAS
jgi:hypothetical protein